MAHDGLFSVLVVDSHPEAAILFKKGLHPESVFPSDVDSARTIEEALVKMKERVFDLLLVDADMQQENNAPFVKALQTIQIPVPFVLMTPVQDDRLLRAARQAGVAGCIVMSQSHYEELAGRLKEIYDYHRKNHPKKTDTAWAEAALKEPDAAFRSTAESGPKVDELTGIYTHSYLQERVVEEFSRASRYNYPVSCLFLDIDHFKIVNEEKGYHSGDLLLRECANFLFDNCRVSDLIARYGGAEFAILMPFTGYEEALELAKRVRLAFAAHDFHVNGQVINLSVSVGLASYPVDAMTRRGDLIAFARQALLRSKATGRNRVTQYRHMNHTFGANTPVPQIEESRVLDFQRRLSEVTELARRGSLEATRTMIQALEAKDRHTAGHAATCAKYARFLAEALGMSVEDAEVTEQAALLHDIGKICVSNEILLKPAKLSFEEYEKMKEHPYLGYKILRPIRFLREEAVCVLHHHEWFNGEGYPSHLKGDAIPLGARIISVVDSYDTIRAAGGRYKKTYFTDEAINELIRYSGTQFDPRVVMVFINVLKARREFTSDKYDKNMLEERLGQLPDKDAPLYLPIDLG